MGRIGYVFFNNVYAGRIEELDRAYSFVYDSAYRETGTPIGFNLGFSQSVYYNETLFPLFENLVSEGWLLDLQSSFQHLDVSDKFGLLLLNGLDLTGSITVLREMK